MLSWLTRRARTPAAPLPTTAPSLLADGDVRARLSALEEAVHAIQRAEAVRAAEHATQLDRFERLYKRLSSRIARDGGSAAAEESPLALRQRLRGS